MISFARVAALLVLLHPSAWAELTSRPLPKPSPAATNTLFRRIPAEESGVHMAYMLDLKHPLKRLYYGHATGGIAIGDFNGDDLPDLFFANGAGENRLYLQTASKLGTLKFRDATEEAGVSGGDNWSVGVAAVDIDADGDLDLYVGNYDKPCQLFLNQGVDKQGRMRFEEKAKDFGLDIVDASWMPSFCDYDRDGDLDLYLQTYAYYREGGRPNFQIPTVQENGQTVLAPEWRKYYGLKPQANGPPILGEVGRPNRLLRNDGKPGQPIYREATAEAGLGMEPERGYAAAWWDYDNDGWADLYVGNDLDDPDHLYRNLGNGRFQEVTAQVIPHTAWFSMGCAPADINNDGALDLFVVDMAATSHFRQKISMGAMNEKAILAVAGPPPQVMRNALLVNSGTGRFLESAYLSGLAETDWSWTPKFGDFDLDGMVDLFVTNGVVRDILNSDKPALTGNQLFGRTDWDHFEGDAERREQNLAFRNTGQLRFQDMSKEWGLDHVGMSYAAATGDLDRDGDLDLVVANAQEPVSIYLNQCQAKERLVVRLKGRGSNKQAIGARASLAGQTRELQPYVGYLSTDEVGLTFGIGLISPARPIECTISWPTGGAQTAKLEPGRTYTFVEPENLKPAPAQEKPKPWFKEDPALKGSGGMERAFDDFKIQLLLPNKLSNLGPGVACGDIDGDGDDDLYLSRPAGVPGVLFPNRTEAGAAKLTFTAGLSPDFETDAASEDMAPLFFDADGDGDQDLFVVSGSVEWQPGAEPYRDRLYLNETAGAEPRFVKAPAGFLPDLKDSGGVAAAADFDRDGDLDLFVGSRVVPGQYPLPASSRLLVNEGKGRFRDGSKESAPALTDIGLVTSAVWSDADNDTWIDLLVTLEWGPIRFLRNDQGKLVDKTAEAGLANLLGWWNGIAARDVDNDGDIDYAVTNFGLNTKYHANAEHPVVIFYGDVDGSGRANIIEAEYEGAKFFPVRGRSCSSRAMPSLANKFTSFQSFAQATLEEIYTPERLKKARRFEANTLESGLLINDGKAKFTFLPFPSEAQISPSFGVVLTELDGDADTECIIAQNFFSPQLETSRMDGGLSCWIDVGMVWKEANKSDTLQANMRGHLETGLEVPGDAKGLAVSDLNRDGWPDLVFGVNNGDPKVYLGGQALAHSRVLAIRLKGPQGNPTAVGARVTVADQTAEVHAGGGYLSQNSSAIYFALPDGSTREITVRWPDGKVTNHPLGVETALTLQP